jgi:hypothetical protein
LLAGRLPQPANMKTPRQSAGKIVFIAGL